MLKNHSNGLIVLALTNMGERFGYYTMLAILTLYLQAKFGFSSATTSMIYGTFLALVYFLPVFGGIIADKWLGYGKTIFTGVAVMFAGYLLLAMPFGTGAMGIGIMALSLVLISAGTGLFKGNLQALVGKLYDDPRYTKNRDMAFSIFYMFINIGAFFAPSVGNYITNNILQKHNFTYDATIPKNYVSLNDKVIDENIFLAKLKEQNPGFVSMTKDEQDELIKENKKSEGVIFQKDRDDIIFNLKLSGLKQYTDAGLIDDPSQQISKDEYEAYYSRENTEEAKARKNAIIEKVNSIEITDPNLLAKEDSKGFAEDFGKMYVNEALSTSYSLAFVVACVSLIFSVIIFLLFRKTWVSGDITAKSMKKVSAEGGQSNAKGMSPSEVKERMIALFLVFAVVIFFWMAFHQNGLTMTFFARDYTVSKVSAAEYSLFSLFTLVPFIIVMYGVYLATFGLLGGKKNATKGIVLTLLGIALLIGGYVFDIKSIAEPLVSITPQIFQQFNPFFIILLTPVTVGLFSYLSSKGKEPTAPRKIGIGMILASLGFLVLLVASLGLPAPSEIDGTSTVLVSQDWLIGTYFVLTLAELFLSPMGLSFVSKVAPPQYSGLMQGGWLAATAVGNFLVGVAGSFWEKMPLYAFWGMLIVLCLLSAAFIFSVMKKLERVTAE